MYKSRFFNPYELVSKDIYDKYVDKDQIYSLFDENLLKTIDLIRELVGTPLYCNTWYTGGNRKESGLRDINSKTGAKNSAHKLGKAVDLISNDLHVSKLWWTIDTNSDKLPCKIRIEKTNNGKTISWLHVDTNTKPDQSIKVYYFNA